MGCAGFVSSAVCCGALISVSGLGIGSDVREASPSRDGVLLDALWTVLVVRIRLILRQGEVQHNLNPNFKTDLINPKLPSPHGESSQSSLMH